MSRSTAAAVLFFASALACVGTPPAPDTPDPLAGEHLVWGRHYASTRPDGGMLVYDFKEEGGLQIQVMEGGNQTTIDARCHLRGASSLVCMWLNGATGEVEIATTYSVLQGGDVLAPLEGGTSACRLVDRPDDVASTPLTPVQGCRLAYLSPSAPPASVAVDGSAPAVVENPPSAETQSPSAPVETVIPTPAAIEIPSPAPTNMPSPASTESPAPAPTAAAELACLEGYRRVKAGKIEEAAALFQEGLGHSSSQPHCLWEFGWLEWARGNREMAAKHWARLSEVKPDYRQNIVGETNRRSVQDVVDMAQR